MYPSAEIYISVLGYILLYCCIHVFYCTEEKSVVAQPMNMFVLAFMFCLRDGYYFCTGAVI